MNIKQEPGQSASEHRVTVIVDVVYTAPEERRLAVAGALAREAAEWLAERWDVVEAQGTTRHGD